MFHLPEIEFAVLENLLHRIDARADENETAPLAKFGFQILKHLLLNPADTLAVLGKHNVLILFEYNVHLLRLGARNAVRQLQQAPDVVVVYVPVQGQDPSAVAELLHVVHEMSLRKQPRHRLCIIRHAQLRGLDDSRSQPQQVVGNRPDVEQGEFCRAKLHRAYAHIVESLAYE